MERRIDHIPHRVRVLHTCTTHDEQWGEFQTQATYSWGSGHPRRHVMTRCDGTEMHVWDDEDDIEFLGEAS